MGRSNTRAALLLSGAAAILLSACQAPGSTDEVSLPTTRSRAAALESEARLTGRAERRATRFNEAAELYIELGRHPDALRCLSSARQAYYARETADRTNRLLGEAYLENGDVLLAERYLLKGLDHAQGAVRDLTLARLSICSRARGDHVRAKEYSDQLARPSSPEIARILERRLEVTLPSTKSSVSEALARRRRYRSRETRPGTSRSGTSRSEQTLALRRGGVRLLPRSRWRARPIRSNVRPMRRVRRVTIHHTGPPKAFWGHSLSDVAHEIRRVQQVHQRDRGWADIGYHYIVDRAGNVWQGRPLKYQGAHAGGAANEGNIGVVILGDYTRQKLTGNQRRTIALFLLDVMRLYSIPPGQIFTHGEILRGGTACPGPEITEYVALLRASLRRRGVLAYQDGRR